MLPIGALPVWETEYRATLPVSAAFVAAFEAAALQLGMNWKVVQEVLDTRWHERDALAHADVDLMAEQWEAARPAFERQRPKAGEKYAKLLRAARVTI